jgi:hypothetical protein
MKTGSSRIRSGLALLGSALLASGGLAALSAPQASATTQTFFAAPDGSGSACSQTAPCSLAGARDKVRSLTTGMSDDIVVNLRGGTYRLTEPLTFAPQDSGTGGYKVIWQAQPGEKPVLSGATKVTGWQSHDAAKKIHRAPVAAGTKSRQLFVNGVRAVRARGPLDPSGFTPTKSGTGFTTPDAAYRSWGNPTAVEIVRRDEWKHSRCPVTSITASGSGSELTLAQPCFGNKGEPPYPEFNFPHNGSGQPGLKGVSWVENAYELLDAEGEFYLDSAAGYVYYIPREGEEDLNSATTELPTTQTLISMAGTPGHLTPVNDKDSSITYSEGWQTSTGRPFGDHRDDVHYTTTNGDSATITFTGTGIDVLSETNSDEGDIDVYVDGALDKPATGHRTGDRRAQQVIYTKTGLTQGTHTVKLEKKSGRFMIIDGYVPVTAPITPVHDIALRGITFAYTTWLGPNGPDGYRDGQAGTIWTGSPAVVSRIPAAVTVSRGKSIEISGGEFIHLGGSGVDLADGTQDSAVTGNRITDISGIGVNVGEYDDHWLTDPARMTSRNKVDNNAISYVGQEYEDAVAILVGYSRKVTVAHNDISHLPYSGISVGWGWGWDSPYGQLDRHGTNYARDNHITANRVNDVMRILRDGSLIYTLGGQGDGSVKSTITGNVLSIATRGKAYGIYLDEGSSWWNVSGNVVAQAAVRWFQIWTNSVHDSTVRNNYSDAPGSDAPGTRVTIKDNTFVTDKVSPDDTDNTYVTDGVWPADAKAIIASAGLEPAYKHLAAPDAYLGNDALFSDLLAPAKIAYNGAWQHYRSHDNGDLNQDVHYTRTNGDSVTFSFTGTGIRVLGELSSDQGTLAVTLNGEPVDPIDTATTGPKQYQQTIYQTPDLPYGNHTVKLTKQSGTYATIDGYLLDRTINNTDPTLTYTGSWHTLGNRGFGDYGDDVHFSTTNGDSVTATWTGTGVDVITEKNSDQGDVDIYVDGQYRTTADTTNPTRQAQQRIYRIDGLTLGPHTIRLVKKNGRYLVIDRFTFR